MKRPVSWLLKAKEAKKIRVLQVTIFARFAWSLIKNKSMLNWILVSIFIAFLASWLGLKMQTFVLCARKPLACLKE